MSGQSQSVELAHVIMAETDRPWDECLTAAIGLVRAAKEQSRINERVCSEEMSERTAARLDKRDTALSDYATVRLAGLGLTCKFNGDPRGFSVKIKTPKTGKFNTWGGAEDGWGIG